MAIAATASPVWVALILVAAPLALTATFDQVAAQDASVPKDCSSTPGVPMQNVPKSPSLASEVQSTFDRMAKAISDRNAAQYLKLLAPTDAFTLAEQQHFAEDFVTSPASSITIALDDVYAEVDGSSVRATARWTWSIPRGTYDEVRHLTQPVRFVASGNAWVYAGPDWASIPCEGIELRTLAPVSDAAMMAASSLGRTRASIDHFFGISPALPPPVKVFSESRSLQHSIALGFTDSIGGWHEPGESLRLLDEPHVSISEMTGRAIHEYAHFCTFAMGHCASEMPFWVEEGVAEYVRMRFGAANSTENDGDKFPAVQIEDVHDKLWTCMLKAKFAPLAALSDFRTIPAEQKHLPYLEGYAVMAFIEHRWSSAALMEWVRAMAAGQSLDEASLNILHVTGDELERRWLNSIP